jgi:hypothetical protein
MEYEVLVNNSLTIDGTLIGRLGDSVKEHLEGWTAEWICGAEVDATPGYERSL